MKRDDKHFECCDVDTKLECEHAPNMIARLHEEKKYSHKACASSPSSSIHKRVVVASAAFLPWNVDFFWYFISVYASLPLFQLDFSAIVRDHKVCSMARAAEQAAFEV